MFGALNMSFFNRKGSIASQLLNDIADDVVDQARQQKEPNSERREATSLLVLLVDAQDSENRNEPPQGRKK